VASAAEQVRTFMLGERLCSPVVGGGRFHLGFVSIVSKPISSFGGKGLP
jgi:hypothetical protein